MNTTKLLIAVCGVVAISSMCAQTHTEEDYLNMARNMIGTVMSIDFDNEADLTAAKNSDDPVYHWNYMSQDDFFNFFVTNEWTRVDCQAAFDKYLSWISTNDMSAVDLQEKEFATGAIGQIESMKYTNALSTIRSYALNPSAIDRVDVIDMSVRFGGVDESSASFVEEIVTNTAKFLYADISWAIPSYCSKLLAVNTNDAETVAIRDRGVRLFYANRYAWPDWCTLDNLFVGTLSGYDYSSNRLDYANYVLSVTTNNYWRAMHNHFVSVTNDLLSSGRQLVELSVPE